MTTAFIIAGLITIVFIAGAGHGRELGRRGAFDDAAVAARSEANIRRELGEHAAGAALDDFADILEWDEPVPPVRPPRVETAPRVLRVDGRDVVWAPAQRAAGWRGET